MTAVRKLEAWRRYELAATQILNELAAHFGFRRVEGAQSVPGSQSGTEWNIEAVGMLEGKAAFVLIECRRYTASKLKQEALGAFAYRIRDTGAAGGIIVSPMGLQEGAAKIGASENIKSILLNADATPEQFALWFLDDLFVRPLGLQMEIQQGQLRPVGGDKHDPS